MLWMMFPMHIMHSFFMFHAMAMPCVFGCKMLFVAHMLMHRMMVMWMVSTFRLTGMLIFHVISFFYLDLQGVDLPLLHYLPGLCHAIFRCQVVALAFDHLASPERSSWCFLSSGYFLYTFSLTKSGSLAKWALARALRAWERSPIGNEC